MQVHDDNILGVSHLHVTAQDQTILKDVSFKVKRGTTLAIVEPNGAGKTVLFRALLNLCHKSAEELWGRSLVPTAARSAWLRRVRPVHTELRLRIHRAPVR